MFLDIFSKLQGLSQKYREKIFFRIFIANKCTNS